MLNEVKLANPNYDSSKIEEFKNVWVFCEQRQGQMMSTSYELISEGRKLADELGVKLCGLLVGDNVGDLAESIGGYGADEVIVCDHPLLKNYTTDAYAKVICDVISEMKPEAFLIGATNIGRDLGREHADHVPMGVSVQISWHVLSAGGFPNQANRRIILYSDNETTKRAKP